MPIQRWSDDIWIVTLGEDPIFADDLDTLVADCSDAERMPHVVLDLKSIQQINSSNLSQLLRIRKLAADRERQLKLVGPTDPVWATFLATGLDKVFEFSPDTPTALAQLQML